MKHRTSFPPIASVLVWVFVVVVFPALTENAIAQTFSCPAGQIDVMKYFAMDEQKRPAEFMSGTPNPIYTQVFPNHDFAASGTFLWLKSNTAHGFDVKSFDRQYVYDRATELNWNDNTSFKRFEHDLPLTPRCVTSGRPGPSVRVANTTFKFYSSCASYQSSTIGRSLNNLDAPVLMDAGGNLGSVWTRVEHYRYNCELNYQNCSDEELFFLANGYGLWKWKHYHNGVLANSALMNDIKAGTAGGALPCVNSYEGSPTPPPPPPLPPPPRSGQGRHVILIVEENRSFSTVYPSGMPWLSALGNTHGIATNYVSDENGSLLDYLWLSSGNEEDVPFGCTGNNCTSPITDDNIFRELNKAGKTWKAYMESLPQAGFMGSSSGEYVKRHNPAAWYSDVINSPLEQMKMVPFTQFALDLAAHTLPDYSLIVPNLQHDAHDGTIAEADAWLRDNVAPLLSSPYFSPAGDGVLFITFDNGDADVAGRVFTGIVGPHVRPGIKSGRLYHHENTLRTMMELLGLKTFPGASATAAPMNEFFK